MKAFMYEVSIVEGSLAMTHGWSQRIKEIWIPEFNVVLNEKYGAFRSEEPRNKVYPKGSFNLVSTELEESPMEEIELEIDDVRAVSAHVQAAENAKKTIDKIFDEKGRYADPNDEALLGSIIHQNDSASS
jgi:hypothetical protein